LLDSHISQLWRVQVQGVVNNGGVPLLTNSLLTVNYPWVVASIGANTVHIFPWLKDTSIQEGVNLYDYMPTNYNTALKWVENYVRGDTNILSLDSENVVSKLFPDCAGVSSIRKTRRSPWTRSVSGPSIAAINSQPGPTFPQPDLITNVGTLSIVDVLTNTTPYPFLTNMFNTVEVKVYSNSPAGSNLLDTLTWNSCEFGNRKLLLFTNNGRLSLWLAPYTTNVTTVQSFTGPSLTALHPILLPQIRLPPLPCKRFITGKWQHSPLRIATSRSAKRPGPPIWLTVTMGDTAAIALDFGRVTPLMLEQPCRNILGIATPARRQHKFHSQCLGLQRHGGLSSGDGYFQKNDGLRCVRPAVAQGSWPDQILVGAWSDRRLSRPPRTCRPKWICSTNGEVILGNASLRPDSAVPELTVAQKLFHPEYRRRFRPGA